jgi:cobalamin biosynthesis Mg chelatase CobN
LRNLEEDISDLRTKIRTYERRISNLSEETDQETIDSLQATLNKLKSRVDEAATALQNDDRQTAQKKIGKADSLQSSLDRQLGRASQSATNRQGQQQQTGEESDGINPFLIIVPLVLILIVGIVVYLSIVPEEEEQGGSTGPQYGPPPSR